jgi:hypothetical protein
LGRFAVHLDDIFQHRLQRKVRKDGTVSYQGMFFEVPYMLSGQSIMLVVDPHKQQALTVESLDGEHLGAVTRLDAIANNQRRRQRPATIDEPINKSVTPPAGRNVIEQTLQRQTDQLVPGGKKNNRKAKG